MPEDPRDALALAAARTDQTLASVRDTAKLLVAFREELVAGAFPTPLADSLTRDYFDTVVGGGIDDEDDDE